MAPSWVAKSCKIGDLGHLGGVLGHLGGLLGMSWAVFSHLGPSWRRLGPSWRRLGGVLGSSWGRLGAQAGRLGGQDKPKNFAKTTHDASKMPPKTAQDPTFTKKVGKNEPFELGWHFPFDFNPILVQKYIPEDCNIIKLIWVK